MPAAGEVLRDLLVDLRAGRISPAIQLDVLEAARAAAPKDRELAVLTAAYDAWAKQQKPFGEYAVALEGGNAEHGRSLFLGHAAAMCSKCHALKQQDQQVGPSQGVAGRLSRAELLESMLDPQAKVAPGYGVQSLELKDWSLCGRDTDVRDRGCHCSRRAPTAGLPLMRKQRSGPCRGQPGS